MNATSTLDAPTDDGVQLVCWKVWGGNRRTITPVRIPGLKGVLHSLPKDSDHGGDLYFLSACGSGAVARLCVADVTGHGSEVAEFSANLEQIFGSQIHRADPSAVLREVNQRTVTRNLSLISTGVCLSYNSLNGLLSLSYAGHPYVMHCPRGGQRWTAITMESPAQSAYWNIPLGVDRSARYQVGKQKLEPGDRLLVVTDGLTEARDAEGNPFGKYLVGASLETGTGSSPEDIAHGILAALDSHTGEHASPHDDVTFLVLEVLPYQRSNRYVLLVRNNWRKVARRLGFKA